MVSFETIMWSVENGGPSVSLGGSTCVHLEAESEQTHAADVDGCLGIEKKLCIPSLKLT